LIQHDSALFISDLHLSESSADELHGLQHFLQTHLPRADALFILGDLFEAWAGDDALDVLPALYPVQQSALAMLRSLALGKKIYFTRGNRDFMAGEAFVRAIGPTVQLLEDPVVATISNRKTLISHGDLFCTDDLDYQRFRATSRHPDWIAHAMTMSLQQRLDLANTMLLQSAVAKKDKSLTIMDVNAGAIACAFNEYRVSVMVHGHTHRPGHHVLPYGERFVLPDWESVPGAIRGGGLLALPSGWQLLSL
jgi:UDP-2,3-diacylglucosamine hydrolase